MKFYRNIIFVLVTVFAILIQLANPTLVRADGETDPPPPTEAAVEPPPPTEEPTTEVPAAEPIAPEAQLVPIASPEPAAPDAPTPLEVIQDIPAQTNVVVLNETGEVLPLATQEAANIIVEGDPVWCKTGEKPGSSVPGACSGAFGSLSALVAGFVPPENGTIWIQTGADHGGSVTIDGLNCATPPCGGWWPARNYSLTLQGGWSGVDGDTVIGPNSVFSDSITIQNWNNTITVNNITINGAAGDGLTVNYSQDVTIANSTFENNTSSGVYMYDVGTVTVNDSFFRRNTDAGFSLGLSSGPVTIKNSTFTLNTSDGAQISGLSTGNNVTITNSTFNQNVDNGVSINADGVTINDSTFNGNNADGAFLQYVYSASIVNNTFSGNDGAGLTIYTGAGSNTSATIENNTFNQNGTGINLIAERSSSIMSDGVTDATLKCNTFRQNGTDITTFGNVDITETNNSCGGGGGGGDDLVFVPPNPDVVELVIDCSLRNSYLVQWASGDQVLLSCVDGGMARISRVDNTTLPRDMPAGFEYASGFLIEIFQDGIHLNVLPDGGFIQLGFASRHKNPQYGIMYWDEAISDWIQLKDFQMDTAGAPVSFPLHSSNQQDGYRVLSGARLLVDGNRYREEVTTNFPGVFILVQH